MKTQLLGLLAETSIHPGAGQSTGIVDLPVAREAATDYPVIPGSSLKGALLDLARQKNVEQVVLDQVFGKQESAGALLVSDARLLLLPVRSLHSAYKWVTCPHLLERFHRDRQRSGDVLSLPTCNVKSNTYLGNDCGNLFLEERLFSRAGEVPPPVIDAIHALLPSDASHAHTRERLAEQLIVLNHDDFIWFARYGLAVQARNVLDSEKKTSKNLWYEETIPADALFYTLLAERQSDSKALDTVTGLFKEQPYLQTGGNETVGMGWFAVALPNGKGGAA